MAETWPSALADKLNQAGFTFQIGETAIRSAPDIGPIKLRRRFTKSIDTIEGTILLDGTDYTTFYTFYDVTLDGGTKTFNFDDPFTGTASEYRFTAPPSISSIGGNSFNVDMSWEKVA